MAPTQLAELAYQTASHITSVTRKSVKLELYYLKGHFIEISYSINKTSDCDSFWRLYSVNHYPDTPEATKYLTIYLQQISLQID